jgi:hypothetical protein
MGAFCTFPLVNSKQPIVFSQPDAIVRPSKIPRIHPLWDRQLTA